MRNNLLTLSIIQNLRQVQGMCPVCGGPLKWNPRRNDYGQWAHFIRDTDAHKRHFGEDIVGSKYNGIIVCDLDCNNAVQLSYCSQPVLCDELAAEIAWRMEEDRKAVG